MEHQEWLCRWIGEPVTVRVTYREHWWDDDDADAGEESGYVSYFVAPSANVRGMRDSTDHLWGDDFTAWWEANRHYFEYEFSIADAAQLCADWPGEVWASTIGMVEEGEYEQDYRTGRWSMETLHLAGPADKVEAVIVLMDEIRARRWSPMDIEV